MIAPHRKKQISKLAEFIGGEFFSGDKTSLEGIIEDEGLALYEDRYEDFFDGMLVFDGAEFHVHINLDRGNSLSSKRGRFTLAHELGHYFIDEHRNGLKYGILEPHASMHDINNSSPMELEADYFASCLLIPSNRLKAFNKVKQFSLEKIIAISEAFQTSILATVLRFVEVGTHEIMVVVSEKNIVKWFAKSDDFPKWPFRFKVGQGLPPTTVAGEFFQRPDCKYTGIEELCPDDWFFAYDSRGDRKMNEQCYYSNSYGYVISLIWFD